MGSKRGVSTAMKGGEKRPDRNKHFLAHRNAPFIAVKTKGFQWVKTWFRLTAMTAMDRNIAHRNDAMRPYRRLRIALRFCAGEGMKSKIPLSTICAVGGAYRRMAKIPDPDPFAPMIGTVRNLCLGAGAALMASAGAMADPIDLDKLPVTITPAPSRTPITIPRNDVEAACRSFARGDLARGNSRSMHRCVADEQAAYDWLKAVWPDTPDRVKLQAISAMHRYEGNWLPSYYAGLQSAMLQFLQIDAELHPPERPFKR